MAIVDVFYPTPPGTPVFTDDTCNVCVVDPTDDDMFNWFFPRVYDDDSDDDGLLPTTSWSCFECSSSEVKRSHERVFGPSETRACNQAKPRGPFGAWLSVGQFHGSQRIPESPLEGWNGLPVRSYSNGYCGDERMCLPLRRSSSC